MVYTILFLVESVSMTTRNDFFFVEKTGWRHMCIWVQYSNSSNSDMVLMRGTFHDDGPFASVLAKAQHPSSPYHAMYPVGRNKDSTNRCMHAFQTQGLSQKLTSWDQVASGTPGTKLLSIFETWQVIRWVEILVQFSSVVAPTKIVNSNAKMPCFWCLF